MTKLMNGKRRIRTSESVQLRARELRKQATPAEARLWDSLRRKQVFSYKFRRQHPLGVYIVDFYCAKPRLVIELDGGIHAGQVDYYISRTEWLRDQGYHVIRFQNEDIIQHLPDVILRIIKTCEQLCVHAEEMIDGHIRKEL